MIKNEKKYKSIMIKSFTFDAKLKFLKQIPEGKLVFRMTVEKTVGREDLCLSLLISSRSTKATV